MGIAGGRKAGQAMELYQGFVLDIDGVVVRGGRLLPGAPEAIARLRALGRIAFLTNNSTRPASEVAQRLTTLGVEVTEDEILTSSWIAGTLLRRLDGQAAVFVLGEAGLEVELTRAGHRLTDPDEAKWVVAGMDRGITYDRLASALKALRNGASFLATNTDPTFPSEQGESPGAGATIGALGGMGFMPDRIAGKPERIAFDLALERLGVPRSDVLVIGDRLETDILGAENAEIDSALVLSGVTSEETLGRATVHPTWVYPSLEALTIDIDRERSAACDRSRTSGEDSAMKEAESL